MARKYSAESSFERESAKSQKKQIVKESTPGKSSISWGVIILFMILFWPVGVFLLIRKITQDKAAVLKNSKVFFGIGVFLIVVAIFGVTGDLTAANGQIDSLASTLAAGIFLLAGGGALIYFSRKMKREGLKYKRYISVVVNNGVTSIDDIAAAVPCTYDDAVIDLQKMIDIGYFNNGYIDFGARTLILPGHDHVANRMDEGLMSDTDASAPRQEAVICGSCGAKNVIFEGANAECEYCGSYL